MSTLVSGKTDFVVSDMPPDLDHDQIDRRAEIDPTLLQGRTDAANAERFVNMNEDRIAYAAKPGKYLSYDGRRWCDNELGAQEFAKETAKGYWSLVADKISDGSIAAGAATALTKWAALANSNASIQAVLRLARSDIRIAREMNEFNRKLSLVNCLNGTLDIESRKLRCHRSSDLLTQLANVEYINDAACPEWDATLSLIFNGDRALIRYVRALVGYSLSGTRQETLLPICWGDGNNGKSTIWNPLVEILGDYATLASQDLLVPAKQGQHPADKAQLFGKRFVAISEVDQGRYFSESRVKELTGDSLINCRGMREDFWTFEASHTFWMSTNHLPRVHGTDEGIWRRLKPIPFTVNVPRRAAELGMQPRKNHAKWLAMNEGSGIFNWMLDGLEDYMTNGLTEPDSVIKAASDYREDEDRLGMFIADVCMVSPEMTVSAIELFKAYQEWGGQQSNTTFGKEIAARYDKYRTKQGYRYRGLGLGAG